MNEEQSTDPENKLDPAPVHRVVMPCTLCHGSGWVWCDELPNRAGHDPRELVVDDTRYTCPLCKK